MGPVQVAVPALTAPWRGVRSGGSRGEVRCLLLGAQRAGAGVGAADDLPAIEDFYRAVGPRLLGMLTVQYGFHVAEELTQETLARVHRHWGTVQGLRSPQAWAYRVAFNLASSRLRRRRAERRALDRLEATAVEPDRGPDPADVVAVREAVARLPRQQRTTVLLRFYADLSVADTAEVMGCSQGTVKSHTHDAVRSLRAIYRPEVSEAQDAR